MNNFENWLTETFDASDLREIAVYGPQSGFPGLTSTADLVALYDRFHTDLWALIAEFSGDNLDDFGLCQTPLQYLDDLAQAMPVHSHDRLAELIVWHCAERIAARLTERVARHTHPVEAYESAAILKTPDGVEYHIESN